MEKIKPMMYLSMFKRYFYNKYNKNTHYELKVPKSCECVKDKEDFIYVTLNFLEQNIKIIK
jgi:hypothetical protein